MGISRAIKMSVAGLMNSVNGIGVQIKVRVHGLAGHPFKGLLLHVPNGQTVEALQAASLHVQFIWSFGPPSHTKANGHSTESWVCSTMSKGEKSN